MEEQHKETSQPPVSRTSQLQHLSSLLLRSMTCQVSSSVFMTTYISTHESADSRAVTSSDLHGMIIVPPRIQDDDVIEIDAKLENKHCCVFIWQMNFIRRKLKSAENRLHTEQLCFQFSVSGIRTALRCITIIYYDETRTERSRNHF